MSSNVISIEIVFDTATILGKYPKSLDPNKPVGIAHADAYMITEARFVVSGQATADLNFKAKVLDSVRWFGLSLSDNVSDAAIIYKIDKFSGTQVTAPVTPVVARPRVPVPDVTNPVVFRTETVPVYFLNTTIIATGTEGYMVYFYITQEDLDGNVKTISYYYWDPTITVK